MNQYSGCRSGWSFFGQPVHHVESVVTNFLKLTVGRVSICSVQIFTACWLRSSEVDLSGDVPVSWSITWSSSGERNRIQLLLPCACVDWPIGAKYLEWNGLRPCQRSAIAVGASAPQVEVTSKSPTYCRWLNGSRSSDCTVTSIPNFFHWSCAPRASR